MKMYPFSKKALSAMLAATVALSPIVTTGIAFQPTKVEAATTLSDAYNRVKLIYSKLTDVQKAEYRKVAEGLTQFTKEDWKSVLTTEQAAKMKAALEGRNVTPEEVIEKFTLLVYGTTSADIEAKLATYKQSPTFIEFERVMGDGTTDLIVQFIMDAEKEVWKKSYSEMLEIVLSGSIEELTIQIRDNLIKNNPKYAKLNSDIGTKLGTSLEGIFDINDRILAKLVSKNLLTSTELTNIKKSFITAAFAAGNPNTEPPVVIEPGPPGPGLDPPYKYEETDKEVKTVVGDEKVTSLVNQITAEKNEIVIDLKTVPGKSSNAELPGLLFTEAAKKNANAFIEISTEGASYKLPVSEISALNLGEGVKIIVSVNVVEATEIKAGVKVVSKVIEFKVEAQTGTTKVELETFKSYVDRTITGDQNFDSNKSIGVKIGSDGTLTSVPTLFTDAIVDKNKANATIKSLTNSKYTIVENDITFPDVDNKGNQEKYIETLASKLIIKGKPDNTFAPGEEMTRAQFTVLLVKALALPGQKYDGKFKDVKEADWFNLNGELAAAIDTGIIKGKPDGRFAPNEKITRTQAAIMLNRAMDLGFINFDKTKLDTSKKVTDFSDTAILDAEAKAAIEAIYQAGIASGKPDGTFDPKGNTRRDQMAKMLAEFLISAKLMNEIK
ncbi:hypothetical protein NEOCIP111885_02189 [Pseudoneobacillus rhizosphaerae]|uniref:SLH domain-containing protein n=2 Tax=Pseudoneobacillus rhizosphaerae TaxID=2880968 RepID=A0A9C7GAK3_9BACI|nr:hypothetical protein NEOCIP111885_02189 [Pseudoneobacillus rhizosphaerae]